MKENILNIVINKPINEVFTFTVDPNNTHVWIPNIVKEETNEWPPKIGTIYRNQDKKNHLMELAVKAFEPNHIFELVTLDGRYHVKYTFSQNPDGITNLEYLEWVDEGELEYPFSLQVLENLKSIIEK